MIYRKRYKSLNLLLQKPSVLKRCFSGEITIDEAIKKLESQTFDKIITAVTLDSEGHIMQFSIASKNVDNHSVLKALDMFSTSKDKKSEILNTDDLMLFRDEQDFVNSIESVKSMSELQTNKLFDYEKNNGDEFELSFKSDKVEEDVFGFVVSQTDASTIVTKKQIDRKLNLSIKAQLAYQADTSILIENLLRRN